MFMHRLQNLNVQESVEYLKKKKKIQNIQSRLKYIQNIHSKLNNI